MKKFLAILAVLALVAPAMAQDTVTITTDVATTGQLTISWDATGAANGGPVGFGLALSCSAGQIDDVTAVDSFFDIFIDFAYDEETTGDGYAYGEGALADIAADPAGPGVLGLPATNLSLSFAGLGGASGTPAEPPLTGSITVASTAGATVDIDVDTIRGGVVNKGGAMTVTGLPANVVIPPSGPTDCFEVGVADSKGHVITAADFAQWVAWGKPDCWCNACFGSGDIDGDCFIGTGDLFTMLVGTDFAQIACADLDYDGFVGTGDLFTLLVGTDFNTCSVPCP